MMISDWAWKKKGIPRIRTTPSLTSQSIGHSAPMAQTSTSRCWKWPTSWRAISRANSFRRRTNYLMLAPIETAFFKFLQLPIWMPWSRRHSSKDQVSEAKTRVSTKEWAIIWSRWWTSLIMHTLKAKGTTSSILARDHPLLLQIIICWKIVIQRLTSAYPRRRFTCHILQRSITIVIPTQVNKRKAKHRH